MSVVCKRSVGIAVVFGVLASLNGRAAWAHEPGELSAHGPPAFPVVLRSEERGLRIELWDARSGERLIRCTRHCETWVTPGRYRLVVDSREDQPRERRVTINAPSTLTIEGTSSSDRSTGLALGITGSVAAGIGMAALGLAAMSSMGHGGPEDDEDDGKPVLGLVALGGIVSGAILTPVGWSMFARNVRPRVEIEEARPTYDEADWMGAALVPVADPQSKRLGLAALIRF